MKDLLYDILDPDAKEAIKSTHRIQINKYGVYEPPLLKQLISLRHLLVRTGSFADKEVNSEELLGLSRIECKMLLKKLNRLYVLQRRRTSSHN